MNRQLWLLTASKKPVTIRKTVNFLLKNFTSDLWFRRYPGKIDRSVISLKQKTQTFMPGFFNEGYFYYLVITTLKVVLRPSSNNMLKI